MIFTRDSPVGVSTKSVRGLIEKMLVLWQLSSINLKQVMVRAARAISLAGRFQAPKMGFVACPSRRRRKTKGGSFDDLFDVKQSVKMDF